MVRWRPVVWGVGLQFTLGVVILQTASGLQFFHWLGRQVQAFLAFSDYGARFVFGQTFHDHFFAFSILPVVVFFSAVIQVLYHLGVMQVVIRGIAWVMQKTMHTAATESLIAASNIFIGQAEAPILVRPFIADMTKSELHAMMTTGFATIAGGVLAAYILFGTEAPILIRPFVADMTKSELHSMMTTGFATIAGGVLAAYIRFGVPAEHLLCASVMNAPVALAVSKLSYPETEKSSTANGQISFEKSPDRSVIEAASAGASASISLVANIAANLLAFLALLAFINAGVSWAGSLVDHPEWTFQLLCSYVFMPVAFLMGVDWQDCRHVAELLGVKIFLNEFVAYQELGVYIENREKGLQPQISVRSATIATYALCGFANLSSIGCQLGGIGPMAPARKGDLAALAVRALVAGTTACFITACVAGILTTEDTMPPCVFNSSTILNSTSCLLSTMQNSTLPIT